MSLLKRNETEGGESVSVRFPRRVRRPRHPKVGDRFARPHDPAQVLTGRVPGRPSPAGRPARHRCRRGRGGSRIGRARLVDITNRERRYLLLRSIEDGQDRWYVLDVVGEAPMPFDRDPLEAILEDLLS
jgi:hypothetical protein